MSKTGKNFEAYNDVLLAAGAVNDASQVHGYLCGSLCAGVRPTAAQWLAMLREYTDQPLHDSACQQVLVTMLSDAVEALDSVDFDFALLLPDDDLPLSARAMAVGLWCEGFLAGFGAATLEISEAAEEVVRDLIEISRIEPPADSDDEDTEGESGLLELTEYVRMATLDLYATSCLQRSENPH